jgi:hypothetical protein
MVYNINMKSNEQNIVLEDVLEKEEMDQIYSALESTGGEYVRQPFVNKSFAQSITDFELPPNIQEKIIKYCEDISGVSGLEIAEYQFARYQNLVDEDSGEPLLPNLIPHWDEAFEEPRFTFDYQIGGNTTWPIVVEEKSFTLNNNSALTFSGTHQVHWRTVKNFEEGEYLDMVFFHLRQIGSGPYSEENKISMHEKVDKYSKIYK